MESNRRQHGFSLMETLLAVGTLAIGMLFIGGTFMTGVFLTTLSTERTIASVVADEAFAKIELFLDPNNMGLVTTAFVPYEELPTIQPMTAGEFMYPSTWTGTTPARQYSWSAICRRMGTGGLAVDRPPDPNSRLLQVTVFVCRQTGAQLRYWVRAGDALVASDRPRPVRVAVRQNTGATDPRVVQIDDSTADGIDESTFINDGAAVVDDTTGQVYRVLERSAAAPDTITLDRDWAGGSGVWVVPPGTIRTTAPPAPVSGRNPVVGVYQRIIECRGDLPTTVGSL